MRAWISILGSTLISYIFGALGEMIETVRKGDTIAEFLRSVQQQLASEFREIRTASVENLLYVKEDLIIPHLFHFDVHEDIRTIADATIEKDESHAGKVVERHWYEKNKHIFPASRWEIYDPTKKWERHDANCTLTTLVTMPVAKESVPSMHASNAIERVCRFGLNTMQLCLGGIEIFPTIRPVGIWAAKHQYYAFAMRWICVSRTLVERHDQGGVSIVSNAMRETWPQYHEHFIPSAPFVCKNPSQIYLQPNTSSVCLPCLHDRNRFLNSMQLELLRRVHWKPSKLHDIFLKVGHLELTKPSHDQVGVSNSIQCHVEKMASIPWALQWAQPSGLRLVALMGMS
eukprot:Gb_00497 [translate_table: standard]